jgi:N-acetylmuramoyl-L-alanine amidase
MTITNHKLDGATYVPTVHIAGTINPELIVVHDATHHLQKYPHKNSVVHYLKRNTRKVAYHVLLERDGSVVQMAPFNRKVHHAGRSSWKGKDSCNEFSIGVAMANPGPLKGTPENAKSWFNQWYDQGVVRKKSALHGSSELWLQYTDAQLETLQRIVSELKATYNIEDVAGHYQVSPGRKIDTSPLLDLKSLGQTEPPEVEIQPECHQVLASNSREYKTAGVVKTGAATGAIAGAGLEIGKAAGVENITLVKSYLDLTSSFITAYGVTMAIAACVAGWAAMELIQRWKRESYDEGRYEPSGAADNEAGGDWL